MFCPTEAWVKSQRWVPIASITSWGRVATPATAR